MKLYLVQHAQAEPKQVDPQRPLTKQGRSDICRVADFIKPLHLSVEYLWQSGKKRAEQTAEVLAEVVAVRKDTAAREGLAPNDDVKAIKKQIEAARQDTMLVGHLPFMDKLASLLLTGNETAGTNILQTGRHRLPGVYRRNPMANQMDVNTRTARLKSTK